MRVNASSISCNVGLAWIMLLSVTGKMPFSVLLACLTMYIPSFVCDVDYQVRRSTKLEGIAKESRVENVYVILKESFVFPPYFSSHLACSRCSVLEE